MYLSSLKTQKIAINIIPVLTEQQGNPAASHSQSLPVLSLVEAKAFQEQPLVSSSNTKEASTLHRHHQTKVNIPNPMGFLMALPRWRQCTSMFIPVFIASVKYSGSGNHCLKYSLMYRGDDWHSKFPGESGPWFLCLQVMWSWAHCNVCRQNKLQHHFSSLNEYMNVHKIKPRKHKPCNPLAPNCCLCRQPLLKTCLSPWAVRAPALSQSHPGVTGHDAVSLPAKLLHLLCLPGPAQIIFLNFAFFFFVLNGYISFNKERTDGKQESECICWTPNCVRGFLLLLSLNSGNVVFAEAKV